MPPGAAWGRPAREVAPGVGAAGVQQLLRVRGALLPIYCLVLNTPYQFDIYNVNGVQAVRIIIINR